jgi:hypothetical protein
LGCPNVFHIAVGFHLRFHVLIGPDIGRVALRVFRISVILSVTEVHACIDGRAVGPEAKIEPPDIDKSGVGGDLTSGPWLATEIVLAAVGAVVEIVAAGLIKVLRPRVGAAESENLSAMGYDENVVADGDVLDLASAKHERRALAILHIVGNAGRRQSTVLFSNRQSIPFQKKMNCW